MQIQYRRGDLIDGPESIIVHGCNAQGVMGAGIAKAIRERLPFAYGAYRMVYLNRGLRLGEVIWAVRIVTGERPRIVGNAITQEDYGTERRRYVDYDAVRCTMQAIDHFVTHTDIEVLSRPIAVGMPQIGSGLGGGDWSDIAQIIQDSTRHFIPVVYQL